MPSPHGSPIWYELLSPDLAQATPFYQAVMDWTVASEPDPISAEMDYRIITRPDGGQAAGAMTLSDEMKASGAQPGWRIYFAVDDVDAAVAKAQQLGGRTIMPAMDLDGVGRMAMLTDPQGAQFFVMRGQSDEQSDVFAASGAGRCRWNELCSSDEPAATIFYAALFGWGTDNAMAMGDAGNYRFLELGGTPIGAISPMMPPGWNPAWMPYFGVSDIDAAKQAVEQSGGRVMMGPHEIPGGGWIIVAFDPQGISVGFVGPKTG